MEDDPIVGVSEFLPNFMDRGNLTLGLPTPLAFAYLIGLGWLPDLGGLGLPTSLFGTLHLTTIFFL